MKAILILPVLTKILNVIVFAFGAYYFKPSAETLQTDKKPVENKVSDDKPIEVKENENSADL